MTRPGSPLEPRGADLALGAAVLLARLPFLFAGYGSDADAWRVAWTGRMIAATGAYQSSRAPGNPIPELAAAALARFPAPALNALTALFGAAAAVLFGMILRRLGCRAWIAGALALAFTPVVAIHGSDAMDYLWALAFVLAGFVAALERRAALAGLCVGVASGCRITSIAMLVPLSIVIGARAGDGGAVSAPGRSRARAVLALWAVGLAAGAAAFAPVIATYGAGFLHDYETGYPPLLYVLKNLTVDVWGVIGCVGLALASIAALVRTARRSGGGAIPQGSAAPLAAAVAVIVEIAIFLRLPHDAAYLIPAVPFAILLLARGLSTRGFVALCVALVLSSFALKVSEPGKPDSPPVGSPGRVIHAGGRALQVDLLPGPLEHDHLRRVLGERYARRVREAARDLPGPAVLIAYEWLPYLRVLSDGNGEGRTRYAYLLDAAQLDSVRRAGSIVYHLPDAESETMKRFGVDLLARGSVALRVSSR